VVTRFTDRASHRGELLGFPASGRQVTVQSVNIEVVRDGLIREVGHLEDLAGLMAQLSAGAEASVAAGPAS
jgi:predicted ester cyclase